MPPDEQVFKFHGYSGPCPKPPLPKHPAPEAKQEQCSQVTSEYSEQEAVAHSVISGALFDFMGWLTSRKDRIVLSSADNASPAVEVITQFAKMRGLSLADAKVREWQERLTHPAPSVNAQELNRLYEELRIATDGGSESMTHEDALESVTYMYGRISELEQENTRLSSHMTDLRSIHAKRISELEAKNAQLLGALKRILGAGGLFSEPASGQHAREIANAAIAAVEGKV